MAEDISQHAQHDRAHRFQHVPTSPACHPRYHVLVEVNRCISPTRAGLRARVRPWAASSAASSCSSPPAVPASAAPWPVIRRLPPPSLSPRRVRLWCHLLFRPFVRRTLAAAALLPGWSCSSPSSCGMFHRPRTQKIPHDTIGTHADFFPGPGPRPVGRSGRLIIG